MTTPCTPHHNYLLAAMATADFERLRPHLETVELELGRSIYEPGSEMPYVYFPTTAIISILHLTQDGGSAETAVVGCEGAVGFSPCRTV
jgi:hypothetical protein